MTPKPETPHVPDDNDGTWDIDDSEPKNPFVCSDTHTNTCEDCSSVTHTGTYEEVASVAQAPG